MVVHARLLVVAVMAWPGWAAAQVPTVEDARQLYLSARFREAAEAFEAVLLRPDLDVRDAAEAHVHLAVLRQTLGEPLRAQAHAEAAVALVPDIAVPDGAAEEVLHAIDEARARFHGRTPLLVVSAQPRSGAPQRPVRAHLEPAPGALGLTLSLRCTDPEDPSHDAVAQGAPPEVEVSVASDRAVRCEAAARTAGGAVLVGVRREVAAASILDESPRDEDHGSVWPWVGLAAGVAIAAGLVVALLVSSAGDNTVISSTEIDGSGW